MDGATPLLRVITRLNIGGPSRQALLLARRLAPEYRTTLVAGRPTEAEGELTDPDVAITRASLVREVSPRDDARALAQVRGILSRERPALVHTHQAKAGTVARLAAQSVRHRPKLVHTFHGHVLEGYFRPAVQRTFVAVERALARRTDLLIAVSEEVRDDLLELGIARPEQVRVVPLGLDLSRHHEVHGPSGVLRTQLGLGPDVPLVGLVGRLVPIKDPSLAVRAVARVPDAHLAIVGDGELRPALEAEVAAAGLGDRVHFAGWHRDMPAVLSDLDVALLTSRNEGTPVALIEAAACARPAVATQVGGVASVVADGETGLLVPSGDEAGLAEALTALLGDPARRAAMGAAGRQRAVRWSDARLVADIRAIYAELLA